MIISFDIFDTAIYRLVQKPTDVFSMVEKKYSENYPMKKFAFERERIRGESEARNKNKGQEVTLDEIYYCMNVAEEEKVILKNLEMDAELIVCRANPIIKALYEEYIEAGYEVIFTSDMYLEKELIEKILINCGYKEYRNVFVSSDVRMKKSTGDLYLYVLNELGISGSQLLHLGNNFRTDYLVPKKYKIHTKWYKLPELKKMNSNILLTCMKKQILMNHQKGAQCEVGYRVMGPFTIGFVHWIHEECLAIGKEKIFFLARDGYLLSDVYSRLYPHEKSSYLRVSRKALRNAVLSFDLSFESFCRIIPPFKEYTIEMFLELLDVNNDDSLFDNYTHFASKEKIPWETLHSSSILRKIYTEVLCQKKHFYEEQRRLLKAYLGQEGFNGKIAIVDLSFKGTAFRLLYDFCQHEKIDVSMNGYVIGKADLMRKRIGELSDKIHGWIFESESDNALAQLLFSNATLYERFLFDNGGTTLCYMDKGGCSIAVLAENQESQNVCTIEKVRRGVLEFTQDISSIYNWFQNTEIGEEFSLPLAQYLLFPTMGSLDEIGDLIEDNVIIQNIAKPNTFTYYLFHPMKFFIDLRKSFWKQAFIYRLFHFKGLIYVYNSIYFKSKNVAHKKVVNLYERLS